MGKLHSSEKVGLRKGPWTPEEDRKLVAYVERHGHRNWRTLPVKAGLRRCGKSCRLRWINYLSPEIKKGNFSFQEVQTIIQLHALIGNRWSTIAAHLPKRTDNEIKNYWNSHIKKKLVRMGIDPTTHRPLDKSSILSHMTQWESARLDAESRLGSKLGSTSADPPARLIISKIPARPSLPPCLDVLRALQSSSAKPTTPTGNNIMHSMYAMKLATVDDDCRQSTLSFPGSKLPIATAVGQFNDNFPAQAPTPAAAASPDFTKSSVACDGRMIREAIENESWKYLAKENLDFHDITESVEEAFTAARYENGPEILSNNVMEGPSNEMSIYYSDEIDLVEGNMGMANEDDINNCYWSSIMNMVNDF